MNVKDLLAKIAKGEALTDEEKTFLAGYDPDKVANSTAAAARKSAEAKLKEKEAALQQLQADIDALRAESEEKANANKPELEKLAHELEKSRKALADSQAALAKLDQEKRQILRNGKIGKILGGLKFVDGIDFDIPRLGLEKALAEVKDEDLDTDDLVKPIVEAFKAKNKALLADQSGHGGGNPPKDGTGGAGGGKHSYTREEIGKMSPDDYAKNRDAITSAAATGLIK